MSEFGKLVFETSLLAFPDTSKQDEMRDRFDVYDNPFYEDDCAGFGKNTRLHGSYSRPARRMLENYPGECD